MADNIDFSSRALLVIANTANAEAGSLRALSVAIAEQVCREWAGDARALAFAEGVAELARYAEAPAVEGEDVLELEAEAVAVARRVVLPALQAKLQACADRLDAQQAGATCCLCCGDKTESQGRRVRRWQGMLGRLELRRRYSWCEACECGLAPAQRLLGLGDSDFTPRLEEVCTMMATTVPFEMATNLVSKVCGIEVSVKAVEQMVDRRGALVQERDRAEADQHTPYEPSGLPVSRQRRPADAAQPVAAPDVAYLEMDGVIPLTREPLAEHELTDSERERQQRAKQERARGGKGQRFRIVGREVKNAVLYDGKDCAAETPGRGCLLDKSYVSHLGDWGAFASLLWPQMLRLRFDQAKLLVVLSDGAEWVRTLCNWLPISVLLILDLFHVKHRIWEVANALHGEHTAEANAWARTQCDRVEAGAAVQVIEALRFEQPQRKRTRDLVNELRGYLTNNLDRMDYPTYRARGLRVGSGAVESANYHVTGGRMKLQGMRWQTTGAGHMAALRADLFNGRWERRTRELLAA